jgi:hypothetical protein
VSACAVVSACGKDVDLGGTSDAALSSPDAGTVDAPVSGDAEPPRDPCDPCATNEECGQGRTCAQLGGTNTFCLVLCTTRCEVDESCLSVVGAAGDRPQGCVPEAGSCAPLAPPTADGAPLERCGEFVGPTIAANCRSCSPTSSDCQPNGCYGGWWCQTDYHRCERPPKTC